MVMNTQKDSHQSTALVRAKGKGIKKLPPPPVLDDFEFDSDIDHDIYFATYRPLSNLPTPPPSCRDSSLNKSTRPPLDDGEALDQELLGPAFHLSNLIPPAASLRTPSVPLVHAILSRASLSTDTVALAACILDSLDRRFPMAWRLSCPLTPPPSATLRGSKRHTLPPECHAALEGHPPQEDADPQLHIDSVFPELLVLVALVIASKFVADSHEASSWYARAWGRGLWTCPQINETERCIMENLNYRIMPLWDRELISDAVKAMQLAGRFARREEERSCRQAEKEHTRPRVSKSKHESSKSCWNAATFGIHAPSDGDNVSWA